MARGSDYPPLLDNASIKSGIIATVGTTHVAAIKSALFDTGAWKIRGRHVERDLCH
jgi:hypothetical protein